MGKGYLIDTNVVIGYLDNKIPANGMLKLHEIIDEIPKISVITKIELLRYKTSAKTYQTLTDFVDASQLFELSNLVVEETIIICKASRIKLPDAIIVATAIVYNLTLITRNTIDFKNINKIELLNPWDI